MYNLSLLDAFDLDSIFNIRKCFKFYQNHINVYTKIKVNKHVLDYIPHWNMFEIFWSIDPSPQENYTNKQGSENNQFLNINKPPMNNRSLSKFANSKKYVKFWAWFNFLLNNADYQYLAMTG